MVTTPSHEAQAAEGAAREKAGNAIPAGETDIALAGAGDGAPQDPGGSAPPNAPPGTQAPPVVLPPTGSPFNDKRGEIASRFQEVRNEEAADQDDISMFARSAGMPPDFQQMTQPEPAVADDTGAEAPAADAVDDGAPPAPEPQRTVVLKVRGKEIEMPLDEVIAKAQIAVASEDILEKAKGTARELDTLLDNARRQTRPAVEGTNQTPQNGRDTTGQPTPADNPENPPARPKLTEAIQFGDPDDAERLLRQTIQQQTDETVRRALYEQRLADEGARSAKVLRDFGDQNPEIAGDPRARAAIEVEMIKLQEEDLRKLGLDPARIRPDGQPAQPTDIANAHRHYRATGMNVRAPDELLRTAKDDFLEWKGIKKSPEQQPTALPDNAPPRVAVTVQRQERRQAVAQQPARTSAPPPPAPPPVSQDRSAVVERMKAMRAAKRGTVLGVG